MVTKVLLHCVDRQIRIENALSHWHVDDILVTKRVSLLNDGDAATVGLPNAPASVDHFFDTVMKGLTRYQNRMTTSYHYRLIRDWGYGRPWQKLLVIIDPTEFTRSSTEDVAVGVKELQELFDHLLPSCSISYR